MGEYERAIHNNSKSSSAHLYEHDSCDLGKNLFPRQSHRFLRAPCLLTNINNSRKKSICCNPGSILDVFFPRHQPHFETTGNLTYLFSGRTFLSWFSLRDTESEFRTTLQGVGRKTLCDNHESCFLFRAHVFCHTAVCLDDLSLSYRYRSFLERHILLFRKHFLVKLHTV